VPDPGEIQLPTDGGGQKLRTITVTTIVDGVIQTVNMEVLSISDDQGNVINEFVDYQWQAEMLMEAKRIRQGVQRLLGAFGAGPILDGAEEV